MSMFKNLDTEGLEEEQDVLGGRRILPSDIYIATIKTAYGMQSDGGALGIAFTFEIGGQDYRENVWVTNRNQENYYTDKNDKKRGLPGFTVANDIALIACETDLTELESEDKIIAVYDAAEGKEVNKSVPMFMDLLNQKVALAIFEEKEWKQVKTDKGYVDGDETITINRISKVFHPELKVTVVEAMNGKEAEFWDSWINMNKDRVVDKTARRKSGGSTPAGATKGFAKPKQSLFGNK